MSDPGTDNPTILSILSPQPPYLYEWDEEKSRRGQTSINPKLKKLGLPKIEIVDKDVFVKAGRDLLDLVKANNFQYKNKTFLDQASIQHYHPVPGNRSHFPQSEEDGVLTDGRHNRDAVDEVWRLTEKDFPSKRSQFSAEVSIEGVGVMSITYDEFKKRVLNLDLLPRDEHQVLIDRGLLILDHHLSTRSNSRERETDCSTSSGLTHATDVRQVVKRVADEESQSDGGMSTVRGARKNHRRRQYSENTSDLLRQGGGYMIFYRIMYCELFDTRCHIFMHAPGLKIDKHSTTPELWLQALERAGPIQVALFEEKDLPLLPVARLGLRHLAREGTPWDVLA
ncbi:hypothetical protein GQ607_011896 [Colletotrichum asianum]|uniref:Uncharacterized protein n=1 Tax=Colletotrichum asianum TaxID=702518 RepID=A0A8H3ZMC3_9PEZI|nr:hypothetical protein GQ607_011896 [Colletotrichum asianum]